MNIKIERLQIQNDQQMMALAKWENDPDLYHLVRPISKEHPWEKTTLSALKDRYKERKWPEVYMIFDETRPIGHISLHMNPKFLCRIINGTSWPGLLLEKKYWGTGVAKAAMEYFEQESRSRGVTRVELGVFEFNVRAQKFYKKMGYMGYKEIERIRQFTYWNERSWDDIRMEKPLKTI